MPELRDNAKDYTPQERVQILREGQDTDVVSTCEKYNITRVAYYQWKKDYDETIEQLWGKKKVGRKPKDAHIDLDELKKENTRLKQKIEKNKKQEELKILENLPVEEALKRVTDDFIRESWSMKDKRKIARIIENLEEVTVEEACEAIGITVQTYYNWKKLKGRKKKGHR